MSIDIDLSAAASIGGSLSTPTLTAKGSIKGSALSKPEGLHATRFYVAIDKVVGAIFTEISGLSMQTDIQETVTEGGNPWKHKLPGYSSFGNLTLKRGLVVSQAFWQWYVKTVNGQVEHRNVSIILYSSDYPDTPRRRWEIYDAYPVKWSISSLNSKSNELVTESLEFAFSHFVPSL